MNNYRNYGNQRYSGDNSGCGGMNSGRTMQNQQRDYKRQGMECQGMKREEKKWDACGCMKQEEKKWDDCGCEKKEENDCGCTVEEMYREAKKGELCCEEDMPGKALAMAYVPWQSWRMLYEICEGFKTGTIFKELDLEFLGRRCN